MKTHLGHYEIVAELGHGGMGVVYKGYEPALARNVAIKELSPTLAHDPVVVERFLREARSMAQLSDPHIIQIHFIGQEDGQPFFAMEFIDGVSVAALIKRDGRLPPDVALKIAYQAAQGLSAAHDHGVIHRDIKPPNLMISRRGLAKIGDFGIALANHDLSAKLTSKGELVGTPGYLAPEILLGSSVDQRSDVYALGVVLFELLTGRTPFFDANVYDLMHSVLQMDAPDVRELNSEIDPEVAEIVATMLAKNPARRYQNMRELIVDLERLPKNIVSGPIKVDFSMAGVTDTMLNTPIPITPGAAPRAAAPPPSLGRRGSTTPPPEASRRAAITPAHLSAPVAPAAATNSQGANKPSIAKPDSASTDNARMSRSSVLIMAALMFAAGASWGLRGEITGLLESIDSRYAAYLEAAIVTMFGLLVTGYWFGVYRWRKRECAIGIESLANMKWRECVGLVREAMRRDGYEDVPASEQPGDSGDSFLLHRGDELVLLSYKHGTAYRIGDADLRDFAGDIQMQGAGRGILATLGSSESVADNLVKRYGIEVIEGSALWPKVRPFVPVDVRKLVRRQTANQTWKGIGIGAAFSMALGVVTFFVASQMVVAGNSELAAVVAVPAAGANDVATASAEADRKRISAATEAMAKVAALTDAELVQRRADALKQLKEIEQIGSAGWTSESTVLLTLKQTDGVDKDLVEKACATLAQYEEMRFARLQLQPPVNSAVPVHWRQCR